VLDLEDDGSIISRNFETSHPTTPPTSSS